MKPAVHLRVVTETPEPTTEPARAAGSGDLALIAFLFALNLIPVLSELAGIGRWSPGIVGFATGAGLLTGRELWSQLRARRRSNTGR